LTDHIFGQVAAGQTNEQKLVVSGLAHLKSLERMAQASRRLSRIAFRLLSGAVRRGEVALIIWQAIEVVLA
jgi:hypothetical protein